MPRGFTIIEMVVVIAITTVVLFVAGGMIIGQWQLYGSESAIYEIRAQNILAQTIIAKTIEESFEVVASSTINNESYSSDNDTIVLKIPSIDASNEIIYGTYDYISFERDDTDPTKLISNTETDILSVRPQGKKIISQFVGSLNFEYNSVWTSIGSVEITLITQKQSGRFFSESKTFKAVKLKNK